MDESVQKHIEALLPKRKPEHWVWVYPSGSILHVEPQIYHGRMTCPDCWVEYPQSREECMEQHLADQELDNGHIERVDV